MNYIEYQDEYSLTTGYDIEGNVQQTKTKFRKYKILKRKEICQKTLYLEKKRN